MNQYDDDGVFFEQDVKPDVGHLEGAVRISASDSSSPGLDVEMAEDTVKPETNTSYDEVREASADPGIACDAFALTEDLLQRHNKADIFCVGITGLFFNCLPSKMRHLVGERCTRGELSHERFTLLLSTNLDGSEKLPLLCVGSPDNGKYLRQVNFEPINYKRNLRSWITSKIFNQWLRRLDVYFESQGRHVVLLVNDCFDRQLHHIDLCAVNVVLLPVNESGRCASQPCDQGIIRQFKLHYRYNLVQKYVAHLVYCLKHPDQDQGKFEWSIADALYTLRKSWGNVEACIIQDAFDSAGLSVPQDPDQLPTMDVEERYLKLIRRLNNLLARKISPMSYLTLDVHLTTRKTQPCLRDGHQARYSSHSPDPPSFPTLAEAKEALNLVRRFAEKNFDHKGNYSSFHEQVQNLDEMISSSALKGPRQSSVLEYFEVTSSKKEGDHTVTLTGAHTCKKHNSIKDALRRSNCLALDLPYPPKKLSKKQLHRSNCSALDLPYKPRKDLYVTTGTRYI